jgi:hypothetical protein
MTSKPLLHSFPLQQNWIQTFSHKSRGKILFIFIFRLVIQNIPMSDWAHFTVSLVTTRRCFFCVGPEMALIRSWVLWCYAYLPRKYKVPCRHWWEQVWGQECWIGGVHQDERCYMGSSCFKGSKCKLQLRMPW